MDAFSARELAVALVATSSIVVGCRAKPVDLSSPHKGFGALRAAGGDAARVWRLLDKKSKWAVMSTRRARLGMHKLVRQHYAKERQARWLRKTWPAAKAKSDAVFFAHLAAERGWLKPLQSLGATEASERRGQEANVRSGGNAFRFCRVGAGQWFYCGLRKQLEAESVRADRDFATVRDGVKRGDK